jgi:hypothetical protein
MTTYKNWACWTYILVDDFLASGGCIVEFDFDNHWIKYEKIYQYPKKGAEFPGPVLEGTIQGIWVDPQRRCIFDKDVIEGFDKVVVPDSFIKLEHQDPRDYFLGYVTSDSTYFSKRLRRNLNRPSLNDDNEAGGLVNVTVMQETSYE